MGTRRCMAVGGHMAYEPSGKITQTWVRDWEMYPVKSASVSFLFDYTVDNNQAVTCFYAMEFLPVVIHRAKHYNWTVGFCRFLEGYGGMTTAGPDLNNCNSRLPTAWLLRKHLEPGQRLSAKTVRQSCSFCWMRPFWIVELQWMPVSTWPPQLLHT